jgi:hypothetical protein
MFTIALGAYHVVERRRINAALWAGVDGMWQGVIITGAPGAEVRTIIPAARKELSEGLAD